MERLRFFGVPEQFIVIMQQREGYIPPMEEESESMPTNRWQRKAWLLMEYPESSVPARLIGLFSVVIIMRKTNDLESYSLNENLFRN